MVDEEIYLVPVDVRCRIRRIGSSDGRVLRQANRREQKQQKW